MRIALCPIFNCHIISKWCNTAINLIIFSNVLLFTINFGDVTKSKLSDSPAPKLNPSNIEFEGGTYIPKETQSKIQSN